MRPRLLFLLLAFGCSSGGTAPAASPEPRPSVATAPSAPLQSSDTASSPVPSAASAIPSAEPPAAASEEPKVTLLDAGKPPRQKLRYVFTTRPETMQMDLKTRVRLTAGEQVMPEMALPTLRTVLRLEPQKVSPEGELAYQGVVKKTEMLGDTKLPPEAKAELGPQLAQLVGMKVRAVVTARGAVKDLSLDLPPKLNPQAAQTLESLRESMRNLCAPFPEEAVGSGARWQVDTHVSAPVRLQQKTIFTLIKATPKAAELELRLEQSAPTQKITGAGVPAGTSAELVSLKGQGQGKMTTTFGRLTPVSRVNLENDTVTQVEKAGTKVDVTTVLHLEMSIQPQ